MKHLIKKGTSIGILLTLSSIPSLVLAVNPITEFHNTIKKAGVATGDTIPTTESVIGVVLNTLLSFIGIAILIVIIYAGFLWATARGNDQQIEKAKKMLTGAIIGLLVIFTATAVVNFIITSAGVVGRA